MPLISLNVPVSSGKGNTIIKSHLRNLRQVSLESVIINLSGADNVNDYYTIKVSGVPFMSENVNNSDDRLVISHDPASNTRKVELHYDEVRYFNASFKNDASVEVYDSNGVHSALATNVHLLFSYIK